MAAPTGNARCGETHGKPFLILGGELGNSTGEPDYLRHFRPKLKALNLNSIVVPVCWDVIEPSEGKFDFATVDGLIRDARDHNAVVTEKFRAAVPAELLQSLHRAGDALMPELREQVRRSG